MGSDLDPRVQRAFDRAYGALAAPAARARTKSRNGGLAVIALGVTVVLVVLAVGAARMQLPTPATNPGAVSDTCASTPITNWRPTNFNFPVGGVQLVVGGGLAAGPGNLFGNDHYWYLRNSDPRPSIVLRAERLDAPAPPVLIAAVGTPLADGFPAEWSRNWYYRTSVVVTTPDVGCWRVALEDDPQSAVVFYLKLVDYRGADAHRAVGAPRVTPDLRATDPLQPQTLEVDGYRFTVQLLPDEAYADRAHADAPSHVSGVTGLGVICSFTRARPDVPTTLGPAEFVWGPASGTLAAIAGYLPTGVSANRAGGFPEQSSLGMWPGETDTVCALRDAQGDHGVVIMADHVRQATGTRVLGLALRAWRATR